MKERVIKQLVYINPNTPNMTYGKTYDVYIHPLSGQSSYTTDDNGSQRLLETNDFVVIEDYRNKLLNELGI